HNFSQAARCAVVGGVVFQVISTGLLGLSDCSCPLLLRMASIPCDEAEGRLPSLFDAFNNGVRVFARTLAQDAGRDVSYQGRISTEGNQTRPGNRFPSVNCNECGHKDPSFCIGPLLAMQ